MSGTAPLAPGIEEIRRLLRAARVLGTSHGVVLELSILTLGLPWEVTAIDLSSIDWSRGCVEVPSRGTRRTRTMALSNAAIQTVIRVAGVAGGTGQAVTAGRGEPVKARDVRLDRLQESLGRIEPDTLRTRWNFHGLRETGAATLIDGGVASDDVRLLLGKERDQPGSVYARGSDVDRAVAAAERWSSLIFADERRRPPGRR
ncbi:hypothetical protein NS355_01840 [Sphingomonas yabuuchiae]|uniref:Tyr recombinase domain-containing protein n=1 Tax=Sphingomonas yabuuchiae TaxID=172044 RepID=A0A147IYV8_9SPHN|nr:tyrosine-type recombinase/integrase [Sphingomonas yabuuchiae]KTW00962.1 hypothetical protein NS355_01840 [Sphingomonas yabuuchiae]